MIEHELLHETRDDPLISRLASARILNAMIFMKFKYTACLNLEVSISESVLSLDNFLSTIFPRAERLVCGSVGRNCRLSAPCAPVEGWHNRRYHEKRMMWIQLG